MQDLEIWSTGRGISFEQEKLQLFLSYRKAGKGAGLYELLRRVWKLRPDISIFSEVGCKVRDGDGSLGGVGALQYRLLGIGEWVRYGHRKELPNRHAFIMPPIQRLGDLFRAG